MSDTGFVGCVSSTAGGWTNFTPTRLNTSDNSRSTYFGTTFTAGTIYDHSFGIFTGSVILGIEINAEFSNGSLNTSTIQLSVSGDGGSTYSPTKSNTVTGVTDTTRTYGGATDLWGLSWDESMFIAPNFVVKVEGKSSAPSLVQLDYIRVKVYYETASSGFFFLEAQ